MMLISRYASGRVLKRMKAIYESQQDPCAPGLIAYFLKHDPAYAERIFKKEPWDLLGPAPRCAEIFFRQVPPLAMHKVLEDYMIAVVNHGDVRVKTAAADSLGRYGSAAAKAPLWQVFRYFHEYWKNRKEDLDRDEFVGNKFLEQNLRDALARGQGWLTAGEELKEIGALCLAEHCQRSSQEDLQAWRRPLRIEIHLNGYRDFQGRVAQYGLIWSLDALKRKLAQFPRGTEFQLTVWDGGEAAGRSVIVSDLRSFAASHGFRISETP